MDWFAPAGTAATITTGIWAGALAWRKDRREDRISVVDLTERLQTMLSQAMDHAEAEIEALTKRVLVLEEDRAAQARRIEAHLVWDREVTARLHGYDPHATLDPPPPLHL